MDFENRNGLVYGDSGFGATIKGTYLDHNGQVVWSGSARSATLDEGASPTLSQLVKVRYDQPFVSRFEQYERLNVEIIGNQPATDDINKFLLASYRLAIAPDEGEGEGESTGESADATASIDPEYPSVTEMTYAVLQQGDMLTIETHHYFYGIGAAHPNYAIDYNHYDLALNRWVTLESLFEKPDEAYQIMSDIILEKMKEESSSDDGSVDYWIDNGLYLDKDRSFVFGENGLQIVYQQYEIAPYAMGMPSFEIPYSALRGLLKAEFKKIGE